VSTFPGAATSNSKGRGGTVAYSWVEVKTLSRVLKSFAESASSWGVPRLLFTKMTNERHHVLNINIPYLYIDDHVISNSRNIESSRPEGFGRVVNHVCQVLSLCTLQDFRNPSSEMSMFALKLGLIRKFGVKLSG